MAEGTCPVVKIKSDNPAHPDGFVEINEEDFDPAKHKLFDDDGDADRDDNGNMTVGELKAWLTEAKVAFANNAKKADLQALYDAEVKRREEEAASVAAAASQQNGQTGGDPQPNPNPQTGWPQQNGQTGGEQQGGQ